MNAPWTHGARLPGTEPGREPFAAWLCDDASLEALRLAAAEIGWPPERAQRGPLRAAVQSLAIGASPALLIVDLSECADPLAEIEALAEVCEPGTLVIAVGQLNDVRLYRELIGCGLCDYLVKPLTPALLHDAITFAFEQRHAPPAADPQGPRASDHLCAAVVGTRGGAGATMVATSLAWLLGAEHGLSTGLLDLDIQFGTGALVLDLEPGRGLTDALDNPSRIDALFLERAMVRAGEHLAILSAEAPLANPLPADGAALLQLEEEFRHAFAATVVDLPRATMVTHPALLAEAGVVVLVTELTLAGARDAMRLLAWLRGQTGHVRVLLVANKAPASPGEISRDDFEASIERRIDFILPLDPRAAIEAARLGQTFAESARAGRLGAGLSELAEAVRAAALGDAPTNPPARRSWLSRLDPRRLLSG